MPTPPPLYEVVAIDDQDAKLTLNLHPGQIKAWESLRRIILILAGTQGGKTDLLPLWLWREICQSGPGDYGFVSPTYTLMEKKALPSFKTLFQDVLRLGKYTSSPVPSFTFSADGEETAFGGPQTIKTKISFGYAANPDSLESSTWKAAVLDEAGQKDFKGSSYDAILRRLSISQGRILIGTTPYQAGGWLKTRLYDRWKAGDAGIDVVNFASNMNPAFPQAEWERAKRDLPAWKFDLFYRGLLTRPAGLIYDCFDTATNMARRFQIPPQWPRFVGVDFGAVNTAAVLLAGELNGRGLRTGKYFAYRTYHPAKRGDGRKTPVEHVKELLKEEPRVPTAVGGSMSEGEWREDFGRAGLHIREPAIRDVEVGIDRVYGTIKRAELVLFDDLEDLQGELESYSRELNDAGEPTEKIENKADYHILDALRYIVSWLKTPPTGGYSAGGERKPMEPSVGAIREVMRLPGGFIP